MKSSVLKDGVNAAPQRTLLHALGLTDEEIKKPLIGIVSSKNDIVPGHMNIDKVVEAVKMGVALAGGVPIVFPAIAVCDGIAMGHEGMKYSLVTRELIADSTEAMAKAPIYSSLMLAPMCTILLRTTKHLVFAITLRRIKVTRNPRKVSFAR